MESLQESDWDAIDGEYDFVHMDVLPGEIKDGIIYVKNRIMKLNTTLGEYQEKTGIPSLRITPAISVQNISSAQPPVVPFAQTPLVPFVAISTRMSVGNIPSQTPYPPPGYSIRGPTDIIQRSTRG